MKRIILTLFAVLSMAATARAMTYAQVAVGGPYELVLIITNKMERNTQFSLVLKTGNDQAWPGRVSLNGGPSQMYARMNFYYGARVTGKVVITGDEEVRAGYLELNKIGDASVTDLAISYFYVFRENNMVVDSTAVPDSALSNRFLVPVERAQSCDTAFAWAPYVSSSVPASFDVTLTLYDNKGTVFATMVRRFEGHTALFFSQLFPNLPASFVGHLRLEAQYQFYFVALRMDSCPGGPQYTVVNAQTSW